PFSRGRASMPCIAGSRRPVIFPQILRLRRRRESTKAPWSTASGVFRAAMAPLQTGSSAKRAARGDLPANTQAPPASGIYEGALVDGIRRFQSRHGLPADGVIGKATSAALAVPLSRRGRTIELALERLRWLPRLDDRRLVAVNIPMFRLLAWETVAEENEPLLGMGVIVGGGRKTQNPLFLPR